VVGFVLLCSQSRTISANGPTSFVLADQGGIVVDVRLNNDGPFRMAIDTGANHSAIAEDVAIRIGARAVAQALVRSSAGEALRTLVAIDRVAFGPVEAAATATVLPRDAMARMGPFDGVIGQDVLAALRYTIDFRTRQIIWHPEPVAVPESSAVLIMTFDHGRYLVELPQPAGMLRLVPDSGAGALILFQGVGRMLPEMIGRGRGIGLTTFSGRIDAESVQLRELRVGPSTFRRVAAVLVDRKTQPAEGDGLLPLHFFKRVTFDGPARRLIVG
jgi:predicted aspartyl protease